MSQQLLLIVVLLCILVFSIFIYIKARQLTLEKETFTNNSNGKIFVSIASYRDKQCSKTIASLYGKAAHPSNVFVGLCQQNMDSDADCVNDTTPFKENIRITKVAHYDAKGPTWARYLCSTLHRDEEYFFQIDSHTMFAQDWDVKLINMIISLKNSGVEKPLLSHYPRDFADYNNAENTIVPTICKSFFNDRHVISFLGAEEKDYVGQLPQANAYVAAGMMFGDARFVKEVPFDPNLPYLFVGEEILHSIRFWTNGWDIFTPTDNVIFHYYTREDDPKIWTDLQYTDDDATNKVKNLLQLKEATEISHDLQKNLHVYGLGTQRTLQQYYEFAGIDVENEQVSKNFCHD